MNWSQLRALLWLRWRLTRNQWSRGGQLNAILTIGAVAVAVGVGALGGVAGVVAGAFRLGELPPFALALVWDGLVGLFLMFWMFGVVAELQRSEIIDQSRLMHLPVSPRGAFILNYAASHLAVSLATLAPAMLGLTLGLVLGRGLLMVLLLPLVLGFFFMITAWTYCLRSWLAALMQNQRRRRAITVGATLIIILLAQMPNLIINVGFHGQPSATLNLPANQAVMKRVGRVLHLTVPVLWLPYGAKTLAEGRVLPALAGAAGSLLLGAWGLRRAYRSTLLMYRGDVDSAPARPRAAPRAPRPGGPLLVERRLPLVPEESAALALANLRSLLRAPEVKMALAINVVIFAVLAFGMLARRDHPLPDGLRPLVASGAVVATFLGLMQILFNQFGYDREGFRALVLLPARRSRLLLGKNLSLLPVAAGIGLVFLTLLTVFTRPPAWAVAATILQFIGGLAGLLTLGNLTSIMAPFRIAAGTLKPTKTKGTTALLLMGIQLLFPMAMVPILLPAGLGLLCARLEWLPAAPVTLGLSALLAAAGTGVYAGTLEPLGRLLQRRERKVLEVVTQEVE